MKLNLANDPIGVVPSSYEGNCAFTSIARICLGEAFSTDDIAQARVALASRLINTELFTDAIAIDRAVTSDLVVNLCRAW